MLVVTCNRKISWPPENASSQTLNDIRWTIPERLAHVPEAEDPNFFNMVEYFYHKACVLAEDKLVSDLCI